MGSACVKCGGEDILVRFHRRGCALPQCSCSTCTYDSHEKRHDEHLHCVCRSCGFDWTRDVLTASAAA